jgi:hypothetical protein
MVWMVSLNLWSWETELECMCAYASVVYAVTMGESRSAFLGSNNDGTCGTNWDFAHGHTRTRCRKINARPAMCRICKC